MGEFVYTSFGDLKDDVLKEILWGGFGILVYAWSLCALCNMDYTSESSFLEKGKKVRGSNFKSSGEARVARPYLSCRTIYMRCGGCHNTNQIVNFRQMVPVRDIWDSP